MTKKSESATEDQFGLRTIAEAATALKCSPKKIYRLQRQGRLEFVKLDHSTRVTERSLQKLLSEIFDKGVTNANGCN
jgi:excisionase family DNA binding protein